MDTPCEYWEAYNHFQGAKHKLIEGYLNGWFPKLGFWAGRVCYFDTHAGRGKHRTGQLGSPLIALKTFLSHAAKDKLLDKSKFTFVFIERDSANMAALKKEIEGIGEMPHGVKCFPIQGDCFEFLRKFIDSFKAQDMRLAPALFFIDPFGFKIPGKILKELMEFRRVELFINIMWRELDMAMGQPRNFGPTLDDIFDGPAWRQVDRTLTVELRAQATIELYRKLTNAKWVTHVRMLGDNNATRYILIHLSNHDGGRDLMKEQIWKICPEGGFYVRKSDDPRQEFLIKPDYDPVPLRQWILERLPCRWSDLIELLRAEIWREPHLKKELSSMRETGQIVGTDYGGRFGPKSNPLLSLVHEE